MKISRQYKRFIRSHKQAVRLNVVVISFAVVGVVLLAMSQAATPTASEAEDSITTKAYKSQELNASGGFAIKFASLAPAAKACPTGTNVIQFNGDSNSTDNLGYPRFIDVPDYTEFIVAQGGAAFTRDISFTYNGTPNNVIAIGSQVRQYIDACGLPKVLVIAGSTNDYGLPRTSAQIIASVSGLSNYLSDKNVKIVWVAQQPPPKPSGQADNWSTDMITARNEYNQWLTTPGNVTGNVVNCTASLQDPSQPGWLNPNYYRIIGDLFTQQVDTKHLNDAGYQALANCVQTKIQSIL